MNRLIVANWKMSLGFQQTVNLCTELIKLDVGQTELVICPSMPYLIEVAETLQSASISLGAQDCAHKNIPAFTGGISAAQLQEIGCKYAIVGHSERRINAHETGKDIQDKILNLMGQSITPILCIGEDSISHNARKTEQVISMQLDEINHQIDWSRVVIAYEPVWAIGSGEIPTNGEIEQVATQIRAKVNPYKILYGGSVSSSNIKELSEIDSIDGFLIGSASLKIDEMRLILDATKRQHG